MRHGSIVDSHRTEFLFDWSALPCYKQHKGNGDHEFVDRDLGWGWFAHLVIGWLKSLYYWGLSWIVYSGSLSNVARDRSREWCMQWSFVRVHNWDLCPQCRWAIKGFLGFYRRIHMQNTLLEQVATTGVADCFLHVWAPSWWENRVGDEGKQKNKQGKTRLPMFGEKDSCIRFTVVSFRRHCKQRLREGSNGIASQQPRWQTVGSIENFWVAVSRFRGGEFSYKPTRVVGCRIPTNSNRVETNR